MKVSVVYGLIALFLFLASSCRATTPSGDLNVVDRARLAPKQTDASAPSIFVIPFSDVCEPESRDEQWAMMYEIMESKGWTHVVYPVEEFVMSGRPLRFAKEVRMFTYTVGDEYAVVVSALRGSGIPVGTALSMGVDWFVPARMWEQARDQLLSDPAAAHLAFRYSIESSFELARSSRDDTEVNALVFDLPYLDCAGPSGHGVMPWEASLAQLSEILEAANWAHGDIHNQLPHRGRRVVFVRDPTALGLFADRSLLDEVLGAAGIPHVWDQHWDEFALYVPKAQAKRAMLLSNK